MPNKQNRSTTLGGKSKTSSRSSSKISKLDQGIGLKSHCQPQDGSSKHNNSSDDDEDLEYGFKGVDKSHQTEVTEVPSTSSHNVPSKQGTTVIAVSAGGSSNQDFDRKITSLIAGMDNLSARLSSIEHTQSEMMTLLKNMAIILPQVNSSGPSQHFSSSGKGYDSSKFFYP